MLCLCRTGNCSIRQKMVQHLLVLTIMQLPRTSQKGGLIIAKRQERKACATTHRLDPLLRHSAQRLATSAPMWPAKDKLGQLMHTTGGEGYQSAFQNVTLKFRSLSFGFRISKVDRDFVQPALYSGGLLTATNMGNFRPQFLSWAGCQEGRLVIGSRLSQVYFKGLSALDDPVC